MKQLIIGIFLFTFNIALFGQGNKESITSQIDSLKLKIGQTQK